jgi:6-phosphofructokinase 1
VELAEQGRGGVMVTIERTSKAGQPYKAAFGTIPLEQVANHERPMPDAYIRDDGLFVTKRFLDYARPLVGELPHYAALDVRKAKA